MVASSSKGSWLLIVSSMMVVPVTWLCRFSAGSNVVVCKHGGHAQPHLVDLLSPYEQQQTWRNHCSSRGFVTLCLLFLVRVALLLQNLHRYEYSEQKCVDREFAEHVVNRRLFVVETCTALVEFTPRATNGVIASREVVRLTRLGLKWIAQRENRAINRVYRGNSSLGHMLRDGFLLKRR